MSKKYKKGRWHILRKGKRYTGNNFLSRGLAEAFLGSIGLNPESFSFEKREVQ